MKILLCGTNYGSSYLKTLLSPNGRLRLAGILSRGSERSRRLARLAGTSHLTALNEIPANAIDAAIVAVPGQEGLKLVLSLLERGIPVLAEHPWEPEDLKRALDVADQHQVVLQINSHFSDIDCVQQFLIAAQRGTASTPIYLNLTANQRTLYSAIEVMGRILFLNASQSYQFTAASPSASDANSAAFFATIQGLIGNVPTLIHCQRISSEFDDGSATFVNHHLLVGFPEGNLMLGEAFGPVIWMPRIMPQTQWGQTPWRLLSHPTSESAGVYCSRVRDQANQLACDKFASHIATQVAPAEQRPEFLLQVSRVWRSALDHLWIPDKHNA